jgi:glycosyltransferase involved in cell wall biosynthesis
MVSIIIPCYNYFHFLPDAIDSALGQAGPDRPVEVLVVDDGSTDDTATVAAQYSGRIRYVHQPNAGLSAARNTGMREASHDLVIFLDADDMLTPGSLASLLAARARATSTPAVLGGRTHPFQTDEVPVKPSPAGSDLLVTVTARDLVLRNRFDCTVLASRNILLGLGGFDTTLRASEDRDMWIRTAARHPVAALDRCVLLRRMHDASMSCISRQQTASIERVLEKAFSNPDLHLTAHDRRLARAVCWYQSALMHAEAGERWMAARQMLRSIFHCPLAPRKDAAILPFSRLRGLAGILLSAFRKPPRSEFAKN